jgi:hypothetical protein
MRNLFVSAVLTLLLLASTQSLAGKRVALVIGNGAYGTAIGALKNPPNDANLMINTLHQLEFDVIESINVDQKAMKRAIKSFGKKLSAAGEDAVGLFYYAGHGVQVNGTNYLIPLNIEIETEADVDIEAVSADSVQEQMAYAGNRVNIVILDSCRNNPFKRSFRSVSRGLAKMEATKGTLIAYATAPGDVAADGAGTNSPYTTALSRAMLTPGLTVERMFKKVRNDVVMTTDDKQVPWESSSLTGADFYFKGGAETVSSPDLKASPEVVFWKSIQNSKNPAEYELFIASFPESPFSALARTRVGVLKQNKQALSASKYSATQSPSSSPSGGNDQVEIAFWNSIKDSANPETLKAYMSQYPDGQFYTLAAIRMNGILEKAGKKQHNESQIKNLNDNYAILDGQWCWGTESHTWTSASPTHINYDSKYLSNIVGDVLYNGSEFSVKMSYGFSTYIYYYRMLNFDTIKHYRTDEGAQNQVYKRCG